MKSKRRHELQTNELADTLGQWIERVRPHLTMMALVCVGAVAIFAAWYYVTASKKSQQAQAWRSYLDAGSDPQADAVSELSAVADRYSDTLAGLWAAQMAADLESGQGVRLLFQDRAKAETNLSAAEGTYRDILDNSLIAKSPMLQRRAQLGLAETLEALGQLEEATKHYQAVVDAEKESALGKTAQERIARLESPSTKSWYNWFSRQKPLPRTMEGSGLGGLGAGLPGGDLGTLPDAPGAGFMSDVPADTGAGTEPQEGLETPSEPASEGADATEVAPGDTTDAPSLEPPQADTPPEQPAPEGESDEAGQ